MLKFVEPLAAQKNKGAHDSSAYVLVINEGDVPVNITGWKSSDVPMIMPMYFGNDKNGVWKMIDVPSGKVNVDPGVPTLFAPGYLHIMLMKLETDLPESFDIIFTITPDVGDSYEQTVTFQTISWLEMLKRK